MYEDDTLCETGIFTESNTNSYHSYASDPYPRSHSPKTVKRMNSNARKRLRQHIVNEAFLQVEYLICSFKSTFSEEEKNNIHDLEDLG